MTVAVAARTDVPKIELPDKLYEKFEKRLPVLMSHEQSKGFKCGICLELLSEPVSTPCGHNFCADCLRHALVCQPRCPLCREQLQGPFRVNHVLEDMIALLQVEAAAGPAPALAISKLSNPAAWSQEQQLSARAARPMSGRQPLPSLVSPRQPLQPLAAQPGPRRVAPGERAAAAHEGPPSDLPPIQLEPPPPQTLVPIQYTRRVPNEVPTLEQAVRDAQPGTLVLLARGTHQLFSTLCIRKQIRIKGEGSASEVQLVVGGECGLLVERGGYALVSAVTVHHLRNLVHYSEPRGTPCAVRVSGASSRLLLDHCEVLADGIAARSKRPCGWTAARLPTERFWRCLVARGCSLDPGAEAPAARVPSGGTASSGPRHHVADSRGARPLSGIGVAATDDSRLDLQHTRVHDCKAHGVCVQTNAKACIEECCLENNAGSGVYADGSTLEARRNTVCHNQHSGVQLLGRCCGSIKYNKMYENRRKNVAMARVPWWARGSLKVMSNMG